ncbi:MAG TPA: DUF1206 domain-containing protein [Coleofasciculaceae cyanobacterium]|jgi:hypothetical protein
MQQWLNKLITNPWLRRYILIGYAAKGTIYLLIGILAVQAAVTPSHQASGTYLTLTFLTHQPLGKMLACLLAIALIGYVLRRLLQFLLISGHSSSNFSGIFQRLGYLMSALSYAGVAYSALNIVFELGEHDDTIEDLVNQLFDRALGEWLILLGGIAVTTIGLIYVCGAYTGGYISEFEKSDIHHRLEKWTIGIGKLGVTARGVAFVLTGIFLIQAAISGNSELAGGLQNALRLLATSPLGWFWLGSIGVGFICYGLYMFVAAIYRRYAIK